MGLIRVRRTPDPAQDLPTATRDAAESILKTAIEAHMRWKENLERYVEGGDHQPPLPDTASFDNQCPLGRWLHTEGSTDFGHLKVFQQLLLAHAEFHRQAATILTCMHSGQAADAMRHLQMGDYPKSSAQLKGLLAQLYVAILCQHSRPSRYAGYS